MGFLRSSRVTLECVRAAGAMILLWLLATGAPGLVTLWLASRIWTQRTTIPTPVKTATAIAVGSVVVGAVGALLSAVKAVSALRGQIIDPSQRARTLAEGISLALNCMAVGVGVSTSAILVALVLLRRERRGRDHP